MTADEMIDMMPKYIDNLRYKLYYFINWWFYNFMYLSDNDGFKYKPIKNIAKRDLNVSCTQMLLRLLQNNYLSDYQLIWEQD